MLMDSNRIEELLKKYWNCETSLEDEEELKEYFRTHDQIPDQWKETASLFRYFDGHKKKTITDSSFDAVVLNTVNAARRGKVMTLVNNSMRIAAGIAVLMVAVWFAHNEIKKSISQEVIDTYDDPRLAFEETKRALMMISKGFGTAEEQAKKINLFNEAQEEIQQKENQKK
jgi:hypothetical protein